MVGAEILETKEKDAKIRGRDYGKGDVRAERA
jgi:hypothetical protein